MKAVELMEILSQETTKRWEGKKFSDISDVHNDIYDTCQPIVKRYGLEMGVWRVTSDFDNIMQYNFDFKQDLRSKYTTRGKMNTIKFTPIVEIDLDATIEELVLLGERKRMQENMEYLEDKMLKARAELEELEQSKKALELKLKENDGKLFMQGKGI